MEALLKAARSNMTVQGIVCLVLGAFLAFWPGVTIIVAIYLMGAFFALTGISSLVGYFREGSERHNAPGVLATGIFFLVAALVVFVFPGPIASFSSVVLGAVLILAGIVSAVRSFELRRGEGRVWVAMLVVSLVVAVGGVVIIANPFTTTAMFVFALGLLLMVNGIADLVIDHQFRRMERRPSTH